MDHVKKDCKWSVDIQDVNRLLKQFKNMQIMMKKMNKHGMSGLEDDGK